VVAGLNLTAEKRAKLVAIARGWSKVEKMANDVCLIGSWARGDASLVSDFDLVMFCDGEPKKVVENVFLGDVPVSLFRVDANKLISSGRVDFYNANNVFEARLVFGAGKILEKLRREIWRKPIDYEASRIFFYCAFRNRLCNALTEFPFDCALGVRDLKTCLAKLNLYQLLFVEKVDPWKVIPYVNQPSSWLEKTLINLCHSEKVEEEIRKLELHEIMMKTFKDQTPIINKIVEAVRRKESYAGKHVANYFRLCLLVEELTRQTAFPTLPSRAQIALTHKNVKHAMTWINFDKNGVCWLIFHQKGKQTKV
jgi:predicted nucleotidyltransferase